jgi:flagellar basal body rod protein FlgG
VFDGHFKIDEEGFLITLNSDRVMGKKGTINLKPSEEEKISNINITQVGEVFLNDKFIDQLLIVDFNDYEKINKSGNSQYRNNDLENLIELEDFRIIQGGLEGSNVDPMVEMVQLLETQRNFESTQRAVRSIDDALKKATNEVGKYR